MEYRYNAERDRIACKVWDPHFVLATFEDAQSGEQRALMLHMCTDYSKHVESIAEKYAEENEMLVSVKEIPRAKYESWLLNGTSSLDIDGTSVPASYVADFLMAEDQPTASNLKDRYGNLSKVRESLVAKDGNLLQQIAQSWEKAQAVNDVVRVEPDVARDKMDAYYEQLL